MISAQATEPINVVDGDDPETAYLRLRIATTTSWKDLYLLLHEYQKHKLNRFAQKAERLYAKAKAEKPQTRVLVVESQHHPRKRPKTIPPVFQNVSRSSSKKKTLR